MTKKDEIISESLSHIDLSINRDPGSLKYSYSFRNKNFSNVGFQKNVDHLNAEELFSKFLSANVDFINKTNDSLLNNEECFNKSYQVHYLDSNGQGKVSFKINEKTMHLLSSISKNGTRSNINVKAAGNYVPKVLIELCVLDESCLYLFDFKEVYLVDYIHTEPETFLVDDVNDRKLKFSLLKIKEYLKDTPFDLINNKNITIEQNKLENSKNLKQTVATIFNQAWFSGMVNIMEIVNDPIIIEIEDEKTFKESISVKANTVGTFPLFESLNSIDEHYVIKRVPYHLPNEKFLNKIFLKFCDLNFNLNVEPFYVSFYLFDVRNKIKLSETVTMISATEQILSLIGSKNNKDAQISAFNQLIFSLNADPLDIALFIRIDKMLEPRDLSEVYDVYSKENVDNKICEKQKNYFEQSYSKIGKWRMPFVWNIVLLNDLISGSTSCSAGHNVIVHDGSYSLVENVTVRSSERSSTYSSLSSSRKRGILSYISEDSHCDLNSFKNLYFKLNGFVRYESDKFSDEDLLKFFNETRKLSSTSKKAKLYISGSMGINLSTEIPKKMNIINSQFQQISSNDSILIDSLLYEVEPLPSSEVPDPFINFKNILYINLNSLNFTNRSGSARNLSVCIQLMKDPSSSENCFFGKMGSPVILKESWTSVLYHNKFPIWNDEIKMNVPLKIVNSHHLLFTVFHLSIGTIGSDKFEMIPVGYTWIPLYKNGVLPNGTYSLPVSIDSLPEGYYQYSPETCPANIKFLDGKKGLLNLDINTISSIHPTDINIGSFQKLFWNDFALKNSSSLSFSSKDSIKSRPNTQLNIKDLSYVNRTIKDLELSDNINLVKWIYLIINRLLSLILVESSVKLVNSNAENNMQYCSVNIDKSIHNIGSVAFHTLFRIVSNISSFMNFSQDVYGRNYFIGVYAKYLFRTNSIHSNNFLAKLLNVFSNEKKPFKLDKLLSVHQSIIIHFIVSSEDTKSLVYSCSWFFFELIIFSALENNLDNTDKYIIDFMEQLKITIEFFAKYVKNCIFSKNSLGQKINNCVGYFLHDLVTLIDRGSVIELFKIYIDMINITDCNEDSLTSYKLDVINILLENESLFIMDFLALLPSMWPLFIYKNLTSSKSNNPIADSLCRRLEYFLPSFKLNSVFRETYFLTGCLLSEVALYFSIENIEAIKRSLKILLNNFLKLETNFNGDFEFLSSGTYLYSPLLNILISNHRSFIPNTQFNISLKNNLDFSMNDEELSFIKNNREEFFQNTSKHSLDTSQIYFSIILWLLYYMDNELLSHFIKILPTISIIDLVEATFTSVIVFESKESNETVNDMSASHQEKLQQLETALLSKSAARDILNRRKGYDRAFKWRKDILLWNKNVSNNPSYDVEAKKYLKYLSFIYSNAIFIKVVYIVVENLSQEQEDSYEIITTLVKNILEILILNIALTFQINFLKILRKILIKFSRQVFQRQSDLCQNICHKLMLKCCSEIDNLRSQAIYTVFILLREVNSLNSSANKSHNIQSFVRIKLMITTSVSNLISRDKDSTKYEYFLSVTMKTLIAYSEQWKISDSLYQELQEMVYNLQMVISDTIKMKNSNEDILMIIDYMYRITKGYMDTPELRLTWLQNMASKHIDCKSYTEAGLCIVHGAALVSEYLSLLKDEPHLPVGCVDFCSISSNVIEESALSANSDFPDETLCSDKFFSENGFIGLLEQAAVSFSMNNSYELMVHVFDHLIKYYRHIYDDKKLESIHSKLTEIHKKIKQLEGKRFFASYFKVGFYGNKFNDLDGEEFIYKEPGATKFPEISQRLLNFYEKQFGNNSVEIIPDSNNVEISKLNPLKNYLQIIYVEPFLEEWEIVKRPTVFLKNHDLKRFFYVTPFTIGGKSHGDVSSQYKRKTILTTANSFPYIKTRISIVSREEIIISPIAVALEDMDKRIKDLEHALTSDPPDLKLLQMNLQGCIGTTVNQGPVEIARVFLGDPDKESSSLSIRSSHLDVSIDLTENMRLKNRLRLSFRHMLNCCDECLRVNKRLMAPEQRAYQAEMERNFKKLSSELHQFIYTNKKINETDMSK